MTQKEKVVYSTKLQNEFSLSLWASPWEYYNNKYWHLIMPISRRDHYKRDLAQWVAVTVFNNRWKFVWVIEPMEILYKLITIIFNNKKRESLDINLVSKSDIHRISWQLHEVVQVLKKMPWVSLAMTSYQEKIIWAKRKKSDIKEESTPIEVEKWIDVDIDKPITNEDIMNDSVLDDIIVDDLLE